MMTKPEITAQQLLNDISRFLLARGVERPRRLARLLIEDVAAQNSLTLLMNDPLIVPSDKVDLIRQQAERLAAGEPLARIRGFKEFWGLTFRLNEGTLEPRADSERLIEAAFSLFADNPPDLILDLGTGSGCLLLALLSEWKRSQGLGLDQSSRALEAANENAAALDLEARVRFCQSDWFCLRKPGGDCEETFKGYSRNDRADLGSFDLIISNPPYIAESLRPQLDHSVVGFDPEMALFSGQEGLDAHTRLAQKLGTHLTKTGRALIEIGYDQGETARLIYERAGLTCHACLQDLSGQNRVLSLSR